MYWSLRRAQSILANILRIRELQMHPKFYLNQRQFLGHHFRSLKGKIPKHKRWFKIVNLVPRLSFLRSSMEEETLVKASHVAPRFWEPLT